MSKEERKKLVDRLRALANGTTYFTIWAEAADEIERLAAQIVHLKNLLYEERELSSACSGAEIRLEECEAEMGGKIRELQAEIERLSKENERLKEDAELWRRRND